MSGLACGDALAERGFHVTVLEGGERLGGMAATFTRGDFRFDMGPHKLYTPQPVPMARVEGLFGAGELLRVPKVSQLFFRDRAFNYPLSMGELLRGIPPSRALAFGGSFLAGRLGPAGNGSYAAFMRRQFGKALYDDVFGPAARKVFGEDEALSSRLGEARFAGKGLGSFVKQALGAGARIDAPRFAYPKLGTGEVPERLARRIAARGGVVRTGAPVSRIETGGAFVSGLVAGGERLAVGPEDAVIYTIPLGLAPDLFGFDEAEVRAAARALRYRILILVYLHLARPRVMENQWTFFPASDVVFNRLSEPRNFSPDMAPPGRTSLVAEVTAPSDLAQGAEPEIVARVIADLARLRLIAEIDVVDSHTQRLEHGYPVWLAGFESARETLLSRVDAVRNVYPLGRQGLYEYVGICDCVDMALKTAEHIASGVPHEGWTYIRRELESYPVVD